MQNDEKSLGVGGRDFLSQGPTTVGWVPGRKGLILQQHKNFLDKFTLCILSKYLTPPLSTHKQNVLNFNTWEWTINT